MPFSMTNEMMRSIIMDHYAHPNNKRTPKGEGYKQIHMHSDNCIDDINVYIKVENNIVTDACFDGVGCTIATSSTDILCDLAVGKTVEETLKIIEEYDRMMKEESYDEDLLEEAGAFKNTSKQAARIRCATIGFRGVEALLKE